MNSFKKFFSPIIFVLSTFLLFYTFYKSEIFWNGEKRNYYFFNYIISLSLFFFSIFTFLINKKIKEYVIIISVSFLVSLYLIEGFLILKNKTSTELYLKSKLFKNKTGKIYDKRSKFEFYEDLKKKDDSVVVNVNPSEYYKKEGYKLFPLSGISNSKTVHCNENGYYSIYQSDRYGFNNPDEEWNNKIVEYIVVGDSFVAGECVNRPNDIPSNLRKLSNKSVLNLAYSSNGPLIEYATLREYLNLNAKKVLWFYFEGNDLRNLVSEEKNDILLNYLNDPNFSQNLKLKQDEINSLANDLIKIERKKERIKKEKDNFIYNFINFIKLLNLRVLLSIIPSASISTEPYQEQYKLDRFKQILRLTKDLTNKNNSDLYFVYLPDINRFTKKNYDNAYFSLIKDLCKNLNIPFINVHKEILKTNINPLTLFAYEFGTPHFNIEGNKKVSTIVYEMTKN